VFPNPLLAQNPTLAEILGETLTRQVLPFGHVAAALPYWFSMPYSYHDGKFHAPCPGYILEINCFDGTNLRNRILTTPVRFSIGDYLQVQATADAPYVQVDAWLNGVILTGSNLNIISPIADLVGNLVVVLKHKYVTGI
jgi:hypothetical protein